MMAKYNRVRDSSYMDQIARVFPGYLVKDITFQVTEDCNLHCTYCYQICKSRAVMDIETAKKFIDRLYEASADEEEQKNIAVVLNFVGGEPFLQTNLIDEICTYWVYKGLQLRHPWGTHYMIAASTNGTLICTDEVKAFIKKWRSRLSISVSLDGNKELHDACRVFSDGSGSYDKALEAVYYLREVFNDIPTKMTLAPENIEHTFAALKNLVDLDYKHIHVNCVFEEGWTIEHARIEYQQLKKFIDYLFEVNREWIFISMFKEDFYGPMLDEDTQNWCGGDGRMIAVNASGKIYPCLRYMESSLGSDIAPIVCGHVDTGIDLAQLKDMRGLTRQSQSTEECLNCPVASGCAWCTAYNYQRFGTINRRATFICWMHRAESLVNMYFWNRVYEKYEMPQRMERKLPDELALQIIDQQELDNLDKYWR